MKSEFLKYIGAEDSLAGYSRSYKLVLYKAFFSLMDSSGNASGYKVAESFRSFYVDRVRRGLKADLNVDSRIENIEQSSVQDVYDIILLNPFKHISDRGYLSRNQLTGQTVRGANPSISAKSSQANSLRRLFIKTSRAIYCQKPSFALY